MVILCMIIAVRFKNMPYSPHQQGMISPQQLVALIWIIAWAVSHSSGHSSLCAKWPSIEWVAPPTKQSSVCGKKTEERLQRRENPASNFSLSLAFLAVVLSCHSSIVWFFRLLELSKCKSFSILSRLGPHGRRELRSDLSTTNRLVERT